MAPLAAAPRDQRQKSTKPGLMDRRARIVQASCLPGRPPAWFTTRGGWETMISGGCLCGAVRYKTAAEPITTRLCWCRLCQFIAAGNASVNVCFPSVGMSITGETRAFQSTADSGNRMHRRFCPTCGTHLFSEAEARPHSSLFVQAHWMTETLPALPRQSGPPKLHRGPVLTRACQPFQDRLRRLPDHPAVFGPPAASTTMF